ncbi:Protein krasavietz [Eumeta japonica]|uniref:Protein krasavietz n=1 Tax=Eumeta variegata TaxID=151549 RepID=A0A4C1TEK8_EUMVA|nr:Protein krasavietz [Eumeta japonica]
MTRGEWNKKEELLAEQAAKHLRAYTPLLAAFASTARAEMALLLKVQEYCYENMSFMRAFQKLVLLLYKKNVLSEEVILKWYREPNSVKGKVMFLDQMKKFVEWLQSAEEESDSGDDDD